MIPSDTDRVSVSDLTDSAGNQATPAGRLCRHGPGVGPGERRFLAADRSGVVEEGEPACSPRGSPDASPIGAGAPRNAPRARRGRATLRQLDREDPRLGDRRRRRARRAVRAAAARLRRLHGLGPRAVVHRGLRPRRACCRSTPTPTPRRRRPACTRRRCARTRGGIIHAAVNGGADDVVVFCGSGATGAIDKVVARPRSSSGAVVFVGPYEHHSNELPWRESTPTCVAIGEDDDGRRRPRAPGARARALRRPAAEDRRLLGGLERDRDHHRRRPRSRSRCTATARCRCWDYAAAGPYLPIDMNPSPIPTAPGLQGRGVHLAAQVRRRAGHAGRARRQARAVPQPGADGAQRRHDPVRQPDAAVLPPRARRPRGGRHAGDRGVDPRRPGLRAEGGRRRARRSAGARATSPAARCESWGAIRSIEILGNPDARAAGDRLARPAPPARPAARELRRRRAQRPVRHPGAQRLLLRRALHPPHVSRSTTSGRSAWTTRSPAATWAPSSRSRG